MSTREFEDGRVQITNFGASTGSPNFFVHRNSPSSSTERSKRSANILIFAHVIKKIKKIVIDTYCKITVINIIIGIFDYTVARGGGVVFDHICDLFHFLKYGS
jgi:hypothetical protein